MANDIKSFEFGSKTSKDRIAGSFVLNGETLEVRALKDAGIAFLIAQVSDSDDPMKVVVSVLNFAERALTKPSAKAFERIALGDHDTEGLSLEEVMEVFQHILSLVSADPTSGESSGSSGSRKATGARSQATTRTATARRS
jgi:hypothetical protein